MFKLLGNRIKYMIMPIVGIILILLFSSVYNIISKTVVNDFTDKSLDFSKQIAKSYDIQLKHMEYFVNLFINRIEYPEYIFNATYRTTYSSMLRDIKNYHSNINGALVYMNKDIIYATDSYYMNMADYIIGEDIQNSQGWKSCIVSDDIYVPYKRNMMFYLTSIKDRKGSIVGTLAVDISYHLLFKSVDTDNMFLKDATVYVCSDKNSLLLKGNDNKLSHKINDLEPNTYIILEDGNILYKNKINENNYSMAFILPFDAVYKSLNNIKLVFIALWIITMIICFSTLNLLNKCLSRMLMDLNDKIENYVVNKK